MIEASAIAFRHAWHLPLLFSDLSFSLGRGETLMLLGRNGRGKTTLLKCIAGLTTPSQGTIRRRGVVGYVPQTFAPAFAYSVFDVVLMGRARHVGLFSDPGAADRAIALDALKQLNLVAFADRDIATLSGGERQMVLIARALASHADILLLDEPTSALDFHNQALLLSTLRRISREHNLSIVMTTHEPTHALEIADQAILLHGAGRSQQGTVPDICSEANLSALYGLPMKCLHDASAVSAHIVPDYAFLNRR